MGGGELSGAVSTVESALLGAGLCRVCSLGGWAVEGGRGKERRELTTRAERLGNPTYSLLVGRSRDTRPTCTLPPQQ